MKNKNRKIAEFLTFRELMGKYPTGVLSIVSDTFDLWSVCTEYLPRLKDEILARDGKIVIRPDSGDPVDIICGKEDCYADRSPEDKGVIELLWDTFGGTINSQGYKVLNEKIGAIYGDSITPQRAKQICDRLEAKGFASTNVVLGIGSYTYQMVTRDTHGFAMKATYVELSQDVHGHRDEGVRQIITGREIFKNPITDDGTKKSARGLLQVMNNNSECNGGDILYNGKDLFKLNDQVTWEQEMGGLLQTIYKDGKFVKEVTLTEIRERINKLV